MSGAAHQQIAYARRELCLRQKLLDQVHAGIEPTLMHNRAAPDKTRKGGFPS